MRPRFSLPKNHPPWQPLEANGGQPDNSLEGVSLQRLKEQVPCDRFVHSQFSQNQLGLYMVANKDWKYIYSAADDKEWLYKDGNETTNLAGDPTYASELKRLK